MLLRTKFCMKKFSNGLFPRKIVIHTRVKPSSLRQFSVAPFLYAQEPARSQESNNQRINIQKKMKEYGITFEDLKREHERQERYRNHTAGYYTASVIIGVLALSYISVPFYRMLCQRTGWGGTPMTDLSKITPDKVVPVKTDRKITVYFESDVSRTLPWTFEPLQKQVTIAPGETALAFFKATNTSDEDIIGVATYNVTPGQIAPYFNKIQCFCFEQQQLRANEQVDMPIFFFIDPDFDDDPLMKYIRQVTLSYTFFRAKPNKFGILEPVPASNGGSPEPIGQITVTADSKS
ncbi:cytochrome c oxidase assembly protein CtaG/Cox11-domain-containing protein [Lipomyces japonicus]|uniref:cytochrome c oxidase assembly protein CtaG/Cox11-domain-containing protein n=1 Tax=Lipomyces japonicus TaxID=56871 RepID=UPI0034CE961C